MQRIHRLMICVFLCVVWAVNCAATDDNSPDPDPVMTGEAVRVLWIVASAHPGPDSILSTGQIEEHLGKPVDMGDDYIMFGSQFCRSISIDRQMIPTPPFVHDILQTKAAENGELQRISTDCFIEGFQEFLRLNDGRLIVIIGGVRFLLQPNVTY